MFNMCQIQQGNVLMYVMIHDMQHDMISWKSFISWCKLVHLLNQNSME